MKELQELRNEVLSLRNMGEITKQTESILLHKLNALKAAINYTHSCTELPIYMTCDEDDGQVFAAFTSNERCEIEAEESGTATQMTTLYFGERK